MSSARLSELGLHDELGSACMMSSGLLSDLGALIVRVGWSIFSPNTPHTKRPMGIDNLLSVMVGYQSTHFSLDKKYPYFL